MDNGDLCRATAFVGEISFVESVGLMLSQRKLVAEVTFAPPIAAGQLTRRELASRAEAAVAAIPRCSAAQCATTVSSGGVPDSLFPMRLTG